MIIVNYNALRVGSALVIKDPPNDFGSIPATFHRTDYSENPDGTTSTAPTDLVALYDPGFTKATWQQNTERSGSIPFLEEFEDLKLVSGSVKLLKTSKSEKEGGTIRGYYARGGAHINTSLKKLVD